MPKPHKFGTSLKNIAATAICLAAAAAVCLLLRLTAGAVGFGAVFMLSAAVAASLTNEYFGVFAAFAGAVAAAAMKGGFSAEAFAELAITFAAGAAICLTAGRNARRRAEGERLRADLLRSLAHDMRTPLASVSLSAEILGESGDHLSPEERGELVSGIGGSASELTLMAENVLALTSGRLTRRTLKKRRETAEEVISEAALRFRRAHGGVAVISAVPEEPTELMMDAQLIGQVMRNLLENAARHGDASVIEIALRVNNGRAEFHFSDNGRGISEDALRELFTERSAGETSGAGVGLSLCRTVIELHGGDITGANSERGAEFTFTLHV